MKNILLRYRRIIVVIAQLCLAALSNYLAFSLRFDGDIPPVWWQVFLANLPWLLAVRGLVFVPARAYEGLWRYTSLWDLKNIIVAVLSSSAIFAFLTKVLRQQPYPRSVFFVDTLLLVFFLGGVRMTRRVYRELGRLEKAKRVLVYGAGDAGEMIVRDMKNNPFYQLDPIGFVDDDATKVGLSIHGVRVLGTRADLPDIMASKAPDEILVAVTRIMAAQLRALVKTLEAYKVPIKILPNLREMLGGRQMVNKIRDLSVEDLLPRAPLDLDQAPIERLIAGKRVLVTGAGGSIGSELCHQLAQYRPELLVFAERYENGLFAVAHDFNRGHPDVPYRAALVDVTDAGRVDAVMADYRPHVVFHAAAHKHVYLMELNPGEAVKNNVTGTRVVAEASDRHGVERFVLISTDKAVNPSSVMGATKRVAELIVESLSAGSKTEFVTVRFGNVLGSNGSVSEIFKRQIEAGGPITITHQDVRRYFMLIPEAVQLVLHAAAMGGAGAIYVLEMGEQLSVLELARHMIRLYGHTPEQEIAIQFIGLRQGEKISEELIEDGERAEASPLPNILHVKRDTVCAPEFFHRIVSQLETSAQAGDVREVLRSLGLLAPNLSGVSEKTGGTESDGAIRRQ